MTSDRRDCACSTALRVAADLQNGLAQTGNDLGSDERAHSESVSRKIAREAVQVDRGDGRFKRLRRALSEQSRDEALSERRPSRRSPFPRCRGIDVFAAGRGDDRAAAFQNRDNVTLCRKLPRDVDSVGDDLSVSLARQPGHLARMRRDDDRRSSSEPFQIFGPGARARSTRRRQ